MKRRIRLEKKCIWSAPKLKACCWQCIQPATQNCDFMYNTISILSTHHIIFHYHNPTVPINKLPVLRDSNHLVHLQHHLNDTTICPQAERYSQRCLWIGKTSSADQDRSLPLIYHRGNDA